MSYWNISFIKQYWRYLHSGEVSVNQEYWKTGIPLKRRTAGALFPLITTWSRDFDKYLYLKYSYTHVQMRRCFSKLHDPIVMTLLAPGEECHLDFSPKSCTYPTLATIDPSEVKIISILLNKDSNCPTLFYTFTIGSGLFRTTVKKKMFCISLFSVTEFLIYKFKLLWFLKKFYSMPSTAYIHDLLPVTPWHRPDLLNTGNV